MEILIEGSLDYSEGKEWKKRYFVMKYEISSSLRYIEIYKDKNWQKQLPRHVVNLHPGYEVKRARNDPKKKYCFSVKTTDHSLSLAADDENVMNQWLATFEEYNLVKSFCVQPQETPTMAKIEAIFPCHLQMVHSEVRLVSAMDGKLLGLWPFKCIRRYKFTGNVFCIEAGRKAPTGEGMFEFISNECSEIYRVMDTIIRTKAGGPANRQVSSQKQPHRVEQHRKVRKTVSQPPPIKHGEFHYDYATATGDKKEEFSRSPPVPPVNYPSPPSIPTALPSTLEESQYDSLSSGDVSIPLSDSNVDQKNISESNSYDSLQFNGPKTDDAEDGVLRSSSAGSYDSLSLNKQPVARQTAKPGEYDKLEFNKPKRPPRNNSSSSIDEEPSYPTKPMGSKDFYNTLSRLETTEPAINMDSTYDSLNPGQITSNTYDSLGETSLPEKHIIAPQDTYDRMTNATTAPSSSLPDAEKSLQQPLRPPPRLTSGKKPKEKPQPRRPPPERPSRLKKSSKQASIDTIDGNEIATPTAAKESIKDVIQRKSANLLSDDGSYATVDHDYASIDYSKVARADTNSTTAVYSEPIDVQSDQASGVYTEPTDTQTAPISLPKPTKPKRTPQPKAIKNLFKKSPATPPLKPKPSSGEEEDFANELKKKLEVKLKKTEGSTGKGSGNARNKGNLFKQTSNDIDDDSIYSEVDNELNI